MRRNRLLGIRAGIRNLPCVVPSLGGEYAGHGVALAEVHEVRETTQRGRLLRRDTPGAVVVELSARTCGLSEVRSSASRMTAC